MQEVEDGNINPPMNTNTHTHTAYRIIQQQNNPHLHTKTHTNSNAQRKHQVHQIVIYLFNYSPFFFCTSNLLIEQIIVYIMFELCPVHTIAFVSVLDIAALF